MSKVCDDYLGICSECVTLLAKLFQSGKLCSHSQGKEISSKVSSIEDINIIPVYENTSACKRQKFTKKAAHEIFSILTKVEEEVKEVVKFEQIFTKIPTLIIKNPTF